MSLRPRQTAGAVASLVVLLLVGLVIARAAGWGGAAAANGSVSAPNALLAASGAGGAASASTAPNAVPPRAVASPTGSGGTTGAPSASAPQAPTASVATPTDTPTPTVAPTPTPTPIPVTFPCASAIPASPTDHPDYYLGTLCVSTAPNSHLTIAVQYCAAAPGGDFLSVSVGASGQWSESKQWTFVTACPTPFVVTLSATGTDASGDAVAGSATFTVSGS